MVKDWQNRSLNSRCLLTAMLVLHKQSGFLGLLQCGVWGRRAMPHVFSCFCDLRQSLPLKLKLQTQQTLKSQPLSPQYWAWKACPACPASHVGAVDHAYIASHLPRACLASLKSCISPGWPVPHSIPPVSQVLGLKMCAIVPGLHWAFYILPVPQMGWMKSSFKLMI